VTFDKAGEAIERAVDIQQRLTRRRREHGLAPSLRIGLHSAEAARDGLEYRGRGVHIAARVGGAASD
jgi:class 3 adenylate cyclase